ncbi:MAG: sodium pump decarboxylase subunit gamma [Gammaproteobacteria bacterium]|nr:sodium pump decarboxylase subunit gamma [Gammaproteobacteria bacterium]
MPVTDLLFEGLQLMLLGMGSVAVFLFILILAMSAIARLVAVLEPAKTAIEAPVPSVPVAKSTCDNEHLIAVISAAISRYRADKK